MPWKSLAQMREQDPWVWRLEELKQEADHKHWELAFPIYTNINEIINNKASKLFIPAEKLNWLLD